MNLLYYGDNLEILRGHVADASVDLIYLDPPFNSKRDYNLIFKTPKGAASEAQVTAFEDSWRWGEQAEREYAELLACPNPDVAELIQSLRRFLKTSDMMAYLTMMANRLVELHRVLKPTGSLYLHCDPTAGHYLRIILDTVFGVAKFRTEITWKRGAAHSDTKQGRKQHGRIHDLILFYTKGDEWTWNPIYTPYDQDYVDDFYRHIDPETGRRFRVDNSTAAKPGGDTSYEWRVKRPTAESSRWEADLDDEYSNPRPGWEYKGVSPYRGRYWAYSKANMVEFARTGRLHHSSTGVPCYKRYLDEMPGVSLQDVWTDIPPALGKQDMGYPTQKPLALLERILQASSNPGDVVLDPFCGCGTAVHAAQKLERAWIGIDITHLAISLIEKRLRDAFPGIAFETHGVPADLAGAVDLAARNKYEFQWWACSLVNAQPYGGKKKGADTGIDGLIYFQDDLKSAGKKIIVSVKGGEHVGRVMIADLKNTVERKGASLGLFITLAPPTQPMLVEAASAGFYDSPHRGRFPKIQILTVEGLLAGRERPNYPDLSLGSATFRRAAVEQPASGQQALFGDGP